MKNHQVGYCEGLKATKQSQNSLTFLVQRLIGCAPLFHIGFLLILLSIVGCSREDPRSIESRSKLIEIQEALEKFRLDTGRFPTVEEHLSVLVKDQDVPGWKGPYLSELYLADPWEKPLYYGKVRSLIFVASSGPNGRPETAATDLQQRLSRGDDLIILMPNPDFDEKATVERPYLQDSKGKNKNSP